MSGIDPTVARALDRLDPPPMSDDFTARVMAATAGQGGALPPLPKARPASRRLWRRSRNLVIGVTALSLVSAAAAATGLLGEQARGLPVIAAIAATIAPHRKAAPAKVHAAQPALAAAPAAMGSEAASPELQSPVADEAQAVRRERAEKWLAERRERRAELGLPTANPRAVAALRERLAQMPPAERRALMERAVAARREARGSAAPGTEAGLSAHPLRDAIMQRREAVAVPRAQAPEGSAQAAATPEPSASPDAGSNNTDAARRQPAPERLRQLRELREHRRELRRQRGV